MILWGAKSHFSIGESILSPEDLVSLAHERGYEGAALADTMSVSGIIEAANKAKKLGIRLIVGATLRVAVTDDERPQVFMPRVYVEKEEGFVLLMRLLSNTAKTPGRNPYTYITTQQLLELLDSQAFWFSSGDAQGLFSDALNAQQRDELIAEVGRSLSASRCVAELPAVATPYFTRVFCDASRQVDWAQYIVAHAAYADEGDRQARDVMSSILRNSAYNSSRRKVTHGDLHVRTPKELVEGCGKVLKLARELDIPFAASWTHGHKQTTQLITDTEFWTWTKASIALPKMAADEHAALVGLVKSNMRSRLLSPVFGYQPDKVLLPQYNERLKLELETLGKMGFSGYFLMVADIVNWAKSQGIVVGPGRGSVGGSLVAFVIGITDVDPLRFGLLFERFINPERLDLPDADLDFASERRPEVIQYIRDRYGASKVALISNYNSLGPPSALREVGKTFGLPVRDYEVSKLVPKDHGASTELEEARSVAAIDEYAAKYPLQWELSKKLSGCLRTMGTHAAGVVIAGVDLDTRAVVETRNDEAIVNWDKRVVEDQGLVKVDILGLLNLDIIRSAADKIERNTGKPLNILDIPLDDEKVLAAFGRGETVGVFQFESPGMRSLLQKMAKSVPLTFNELAVATALYRPGPLDSGMIEEYLDIRNGYASPYYEHEAMEKAMSETGGVMVYQEQVMALSRELCGFSMAEADNLRKAVGKKDKDKMASIREQFVEGAVKVSGLDASRAEAIWENIANFGSYGFNKSHSVEYSLISYVTMWLKVYHPTAFFAACLEFMKQERLPALVAEANKRGIELLPPDVNKSGHGFELEPGRKLRIPISRIKGLSTAAQEAILQERQFNGPFASKADFRARVPARKCNVRHMEVLDKIGAFAGIESDQKPCTHPDRVRDQMEALPGLISQTVHIDRAIVWDDFTKEQIHRCVVIESRNISGGVPPMPRTGRKPKMMVITDCPSKDEERAGKLMEGGTADFVKEAMEKAGLKWTTDAYYTTLCKVPKREKRMTPEEIKTWWPVLEREIQIINPPIIVALGSEVARKLLPNERGGIMELATKIVYSKELDANIVIGINPGMVWMDASRQDLLDRVFEEVSSLVFSE